MATELSVREVADRLDKHPATIRLWILTGRLPAVKTNGKYTILEEEIMNMRLSSRPSRIALSKDQERRAAQINQLKRIFRATSITEVEMAQERESDKQLEEMRANCD